MFSQVKISNWYVFVTLELKHHQIKQYTYMDILIRSFVESPF